MQNEIKDYNAGIEELFIRYMISDEDLFVRCRGILKDVYFDNKQNRDVVKFLISHTEQYSQLPSLDQIEAVTKKVLKKVDDVQDKWFLKEIETFCKHKALREAILQSPELLEEGRYGEVEAAVKAAVQIALVKDLGLDYYKDPKSRLEALKDNKGQTSTGWKTVDDKLFGGLNRGEITIFAGQCVVATTQVSAIEILDLDKYFSQTDRQK